MRAYYLDAAPQRPGKTRRRAPARTIALLRWPASPPPRGGRPRRLLQTVGALLALWRRRSRGRQQLARLDARLLRDIGVTRSEAAAECDKPFWRG
jgi:uncharacterized protein YjiS (DUF1127 family)